MSFYPGPYQNGYVPYMAQPSKSAPPPIQPWPIDAYILILAAALSLLGIVPIGIMRVLERRPRRMVPERVQDLHMAPDHVFKSKEELRMWIKFHLGYDVTNYMLDLLMVYESNRKVLVANGRANGKRTLQEISDAIAARRRKARR